MYSESLKLILCLDSFSKQTIIFESFFDLDECLVKGMN